jgi:hypothetical protein
MVPNHLKAEGHHREEVPGHIHVSTDWGIVLLDIDYEVIAKARKLREGQGNDSIGFGLGCEEVVDAVAEAADNATVHNNTYEWAFRHAAASLGYTNDYLYSNDSGTVRIPDERPFSAITCDCDRAFGVHLTHFYSPPICHREWRSDPS